MERAGTQRAALSSARLGISGSQTIKQGASFMTKPIPDKAEVALEYPDKLYIGTFERTARFDAHLDVTGISLSLERSGGADVRDHSHAFPLWAVCGNSARAGQNCILRRLRSARS